MISRAVASSVAASRPDPAGPAKASPDGLKTIRFHRGETMAVAPESAQPISTWAKRTIVAEPMNCFDRLLVVLGVRLVEQGDVLEEAAEATFDDLRQRRLGLALVAADRLERLALVLDHVGGHVVAA